LDAGRPKYAAKRAASSVNICGPIGNVFTLVVDAIRDGQCITHA
jgi:hypothetical protein